MSINPQRKKEILEEFSVGKNDTGSADVQCAILTERINNLTEHFKKNKKDFHSRRGLLVMIGRRRRLLDYIKRLDGKRYENLIKKLNIRK